MTSEISMDRRRMESTGTQSKHNEWYEQWTLFCDDERSLFEEWIASTTMEEFRNKTVLECGCGGGQHTSYMTALADSVTAVDLNTAEVARERNSHFRNVRFIEDDIARLDLG